MGRSAHAQRANRYWFKRAACKRSFFVGQIKSETPAYVIWWIFNALCCFVLKVKGERRRFLRIRWTRFTWYFGSFFFYLIFIKLRNDSSFINNCKPKNKIPAITEHRRLFFCRRVTREIRNSNSSPKRNRFNFRRT